MSSFFDWLSPVTDAIGLGLSAIQNKKNFEYQKGIDERNFSYEKELQQQVFNREDTAYQRAVEDAQAAGLSKGVVSGGAGVGAVLGTASSNASNNMDWSKLGSLASNYQQRQINKMSMLQMQNQVDLSEYQKELLTRQDDAIFLQNAANPFYLGYKDGRMQFDCGRIESYRDAQFETLMKQEEMKKAAAEEYIKHPWLKDVLDTAGTVQKFIP